MLKEDNIEKALSVIEKNEACKREATLFSGRLSRIKSNNSRGLIAKESIDIQRNEIINEICNLIGVTQLVKIS